MNWESIGRSCVIAAMDALFELKDTVVVSRGSNVQTSADVLSHKKIVETLAASGAICDVVSEEAKETIKINGGNETIQVVIDPIDYSHFFLRGELSFCSVGLLVIRKGVPEYAFVGDLSNKSLYHCDPNGAYKDGTKITVPEVTKGRKIILGWAPESDRARELFPLVDSLPKETYFVYNYGGLLLTAKILDGIYDACVEVVPTPLHEFAAALIVERAGGKISTLEGKAVRWDPHTKQTLLVARDEQTYGDVLRAYNK